MSPTIVARVFLFIFISSFFLQAPALHAASKCETALENLFQIKPAGTKFASGFVTPAEPADPVEPETPAINFESLGPKDQIRTLHEIAFYERVWAQKHKALLVGTFEPKLEELNHLALFISDYPADVLALYLEDLRSIVANLSMTVVGLKAYLTLLKMFVTLSDQVSSLEVYREFILNVLVFEQNGRDWLLDSDSLAEQEFAIIELMKSKNMNRNPLLKFQFISSLLLEMINKKASPAFPLLHKTICVF